MLTVLSICFTFWWWVHKHTLCNPTTPTGMHHFGHMRAKVGNTIFKLRNSALKVAYILEILAKKSLFWTFFFGLFLMLTQSFFLGSTTHFLFLYLINLYSSWKRLLKSIFWSFLACFTTCSLKWKNSNDFWIFQYSSSLSVSLSLCFRVCLCLSVHPSVRPSVHLSLSLWLLKWSRFVSSAKWWTL